MAAKRWWTGHQQSSRKRIESTCQVSNSPGNSKDPCIDTGRSESQNRAAQPFLCFHFQVTLI